METPKKTYPYSWEEAIEILRDDPDHHELIFNSYLTRNLDENCRRFANSEEFAQVRALLRKYAANASRLLDMPGGNGIATHAFASVGFEVTAVEPNPSASVGRGAIQRVLSVAGLSAKVIDAWGENLPFDNSSFDIVYVRQGLHHASNLRAMLMEICRVLCPGGVLLACREHVVDNYESSLATFLASQVDHQLYGGENAFTLVDYRAAISRSGMELTLELGPFDSIINEYPNTPEILRAKILSSRAGKLLGKILPTNTVVDLGNWWHMNRRTPGRLYTFVATKSKLD